MYGVAMLVMNIVVTIVVIIEVNVRSVRSVIAKKHILGNALKIA
jgi:hypothetical protein